MERKRTGQISYEDFLYDLGYHNLLVDITNIKGTDISERLQNKAGIHLPESLYTDLWMESLSWTEAHIPNYPGTIFMGFNDSKLADNDPRLQYALATVELSVPSLGHSNPNTQDLRISGVAIDSKGDKRLVAVTYNLDPRKKQNANSWTVQDLNVGITQFEVNNVNFRHTATSIQSVPTALVNPYYTAGLITGNMVRSVNRDCDKDDIQEKVLRISRMDIQTIIDRGWINQIHFLHEKPTTILGRTLKDRPDRYRVGLYAKSGKPWEVSIPAKLD